MQQYKRMSLLGLVIVQLFHGNQSLWKTNEEKTKRPFFYFLAFFVISGYFFWLFLLFPSFSFLFLLRFSFFCFFSSFSFVLSSFSVSSSSTSFLSFFFFTYHKRGDTQGIDGTDGNQPRFNKIIYNLFHEFGIWEKQASPYFQVLFFFPFVLLLPSLWFSCVATLFSKTFLFLRWFQVVLVFFKSFLFSKTFLFLPFQVALVFFFCLSFFFHFFVFSLQNESA